MTVIECVGPLLKHLRKRRGLTGLVLSERSGISPANIYCYESGKHVPTIRILSELLRQLDFELSEFFQMAEAMASGRNSVELPVKGVNAVPVI